MPFSKAVTLTIPRETKERFDELIKEYDFKLPKTYNHVLIQIIERYEEEIEGSKENLPKEKGIGWGIVSDEVYDILNEP